MWSAIWLFPGAEGRSARAHGFALVTVEIADDDDVAGFKRLSRQVGLRNLTCKPCAQRMQSLHMVPPLPHRRSVDGAANLNRAGGCRRPLAFVKTLHLLDPLQSCSVDPTP